MDRKRRFRRWLHRMRLELALRWIYFVGAFGRAWRRYVVGRRRFVFSCVYCGRKTAQAPYRYKGEEWPSCCSRLACIDRWHGRAVEVEQAPGAVT